MCNPARRPQHRWCWWHALCIPAYRQWRSSWEADLEYVAIGYHTEGDEYRRDHPAPTFKATLCTLANPREESS